MDLKEGMIVSLDYKGTKITGIIWNILTYTVEIKTIFGQTLMFPKETHYESVSINKKIEDTLKEMYSKKTDINEWDYKVKLRSLSGYLDRDRFTAALAENIISELTNIKGKVDVSVTLSPDSLLYDTVYEPYCKITREVIIGKIKSGEYEFLKETADNNFYICNKGKEYQDLLSENAKDDIQLDISSPMSLMENSNKFYITKNSDQEPILVYQQLISINIAPLLPSKEAVEQATQKLFGKDF